MSKQHNRRAFTLIELLVVIAIIAILASILFPVFARARENARRASCMSNMQQIGLGIMQYVQDYDEHYPMTWYGRITSGSYGSYPQTQPGTPGQYFAICDPGSCGSGGAGNFITWMDLIYPYVKSTQVFVCPSSTNPLYTTGAIVNAHIPNYWMSGAYGNTAYGVMSSINAGDFASYAYGKSILGTGTPMAAIARPSQSVMIFEGSGAGVSSTSGVLYLIRGGPDWIVKPGWSSLFQPHLGGMNLTFGDGHVKWMSFNNMASQIGAYSTTACNLSAINANLPDCSTLWNPFLPQ